MKKKQHNTKDMYMLLILFSVTLLSFIPVYFLLPEEGDILKVTVDGEEYGTYPLSVDRRIEIKYDGHTNILEIKNGEAYMKEASCPDGLCIKMGKKSKGGQSIICLPNKVSAEIIKSGEGYDSISQ